MRQIAGVVAGAVLAAVGAVILGEYDLEGVTAVVGFPLYALAVTELTSAIGGRLRSAAVLVAVAVVVAAGLTWALWISFNHFRRETPPVLSWMMLPVSLAIVILWTRARRRPLPSSEEPPTEA